MSDDVNYGQTKLFFPEIETIGDFKQLYRLTTGKEWGE